jgi:hypothetical protein
MVGPSGRACGPPKGMLDPAIHDLAAISTAHRGWSGQAGHNAAGTIVPPAHYVSAYGAKPGHDTAGTTAPVPHYVSAYAVASQVAMSPTHHVANLVVMTSVPLRPFHREPSGQSHPVCMVVSRVASQAGWQPVHRPGRPVLPGSGRAMR